MTAGQYQRAKELFNAALELEPRVRRGFVEKECGKDTTLLAEVLSLLGNHGEVSDRLTAQAPESAPEILAASVCFSLDPGGGLREGARLRDLEDEPSLPDLHLGEDRYVVSRELGRGGMGVVYLAYDQDLKRKVALKVMKSPGTETAQRFLEESRIIAQLSHPNIIPLHDVGLTSARKLYYTMPVVTGRSLETVVRGLKAGEPEVVRQYSLARRVQVLAQVCQAVSYAHAKGVVHRDLKPSNVMLGSHGEVLVMDWGLSKVLEVADVKTGIEHSLTRSGHVVGTPWYMSPEQVSGSDLDGRSDVWSLGAMLYELLCLERPFTGGAMEVMASVLRDEPQPPRQRRPEADIPLELEAVCLKALSKDREDRLASSDEMLSSLREWLEAQADKAKRHERAEEKASQGRERLAEHSRLKEEEKRLLAMAEEVSKQFNGWQPAEEKAELLAAQRAVEACRRALVDATAAVVETLEQAVEYEPDNPTARRLLAEYYWSRFRDAEERANDEERDFFAKRVARYHDGRYQRELRGGGSLMLVTDSPGAEALLYELVEEGFVLVPRNERHLGTTPLGPIPLAMGSYLVILKKDGYRDVRYPVHIARNRERMGRVNLYTDEEIGPGMIYVPAGPFIQGGDPDCPWSLPRSEPWVADFFIAEHPVTMGEHLEYLNDVARSEGLEAAKKRAPRLAPQAPTYLLEDGTGGLKLPEVDAEGDRWAPRIPAFGVTWHDAVEYCQWRSRREGREYRMPAESEWEKAARGVDGRWFPWGWRFDPSLCNMRESRRERTATVPVDEFPDDVSVYGVRGMAGNVRDWTATELTEGEGTTARVARVVRGGAWNNDRILSRCADRRWFVPSAVFGNIFVRVALRPRRTR